MRRMSIPLPQREYGARTHAFLAHVPVRAPGVMVGPNPGQYVHWTDCSNCSRPALEPCAADGSMLLGELPPMCDACTTKKLEPETVV